jgi:hypothetical protein
MSNLLIYLLVSVVLNHIKSDDEILNLIKKYIDDKNDDNNSLKEIVKMGKMNGFYTSQQT